MLGADDQYKLRFSTSERRHRYFRAYPRRPAQALRYAWRRFVPRAPAPGCRGTKRYCSARSATGRARRPYRTAPRQQLEQLSPTRSRRQPASSGTDGSSCPARPTSRPPAAPRARRSGRGKLCLEARARRRASASATSAPASSGGSSAVRGRASPAALRARAARHPGSRARGGAGMIPSRLGCHRARPASWADDARPPRSPDRGGSSARGGPRARRCLPATVSARAPRQPPVP